MLHILTFVVLKGGIFIKTVFTAINAKFIHSSLAVRSIKKYCQKFGVNIETAEFTINNSLDFIVSEIYNMKPDILGLSCYIWNIDLILEVISVIKKILPNIKIILGGPEVSYEFEYLFDKNADVIIIGEGERTAFELISYFTNKDGDYKINDINGIAYYNGENIITTPKREPLNLDDIPFAYDELSIKELDNKIIYYESSRGCPYNCQYCLSSVENGVRFLSEKRVFSDLKFFLDKKVKQVKFVDRTFNCNKKFAINIWKFIIQNDNGITNFHFEISADIMGEEAFDILKTARKQLFQLEIGVQSTNLHTLSLVSRKTDLKKLFNTVLKIKKFKNIHQHLDLIAGLPYEDFESFGHSFDDVFLLFPEQLQLGFLKLLKGSGLREHSFDYGIVYNNKAPYEVLFTKDISFEEMTLLKQITQITEIYYNSGKAVNTIKFAYKYFKRPFLFFKTFALYWTEKKYYNVSHNKMKLYNILYEFCAIYINEINKLKDIIKFDMFLNDNIKNFPYWLEQNSFEETKAFSRAFFQKSENINKYIPNLDNFSIKQISRICHIEKFNYYVSDIQNNFYDVKKKKCFILFNYYDKNNLIENNYPYYILEENNEV